MTDPCLSAYVRSLPSYLIARTSRVNGRDDALAPSQRAAIQTLNRLGQDRATNFRGPAGAKNAVARLPHLSPFASPSAPALYDCGHIHPPPPSISESADD